MSKDAARHLVADLLVRAPLTFCGNGRDGRLVDGQLRVIAEANSVVGTRGQRRVRIIIIRDNVGFLVENAFPVHEH